MEKYSQSLRFVDEEEYMTIGWLITQGKVLYRDVSTNHQPLPYIGSALIHKMTKPANLFMLLKRHREAVFLWSSVWGLLLVWRYGFKVIPGLIIFETIKYVLLGNEYLAESLACYPLAYWLGSTLDLYLADKQRQEDVLLGISFAVTVLLVLPLFVPLGLMMGMRWWRRRRIDWLPMLIGIAVVAVPVMAWLGPADYWRETIANNYQYAIPKLNIIHSSRDLVSQLLLPITGAFDGDGLLAQWLKLILLLWIVGITVYVSTKKKQALIGVIGLLLVFSLTNSRDIGPIAYYYQGFHLLPWLMVGLIGAGWWAIYAWQKEGVVVRAGLLVVMVLSGLLFLAKGSPIQANIDPQVENYVQYTPLVQAADLIEMLKYPSDRLMTMPIDTILNWITEIQPASRQVTYYEWQYWPKRLHDEYMEMIYTNPPAFIQYTPDNSSYATSIEPLLHEKYTKIFMQPDLYVLSERVDGLSDDGFSRLQEMSNIEIVRHETI